MRTRLLSAAFELVVACSACGGNPADVKELKQSQKQILDRLAALDEALQQLKAPSRTRARSTSSRARSSLCGRS